ncbi:MAG: hypothetical protein U0800_21860 [Isosphaeraceae bacterium]
MAMRRHPDARQAMFGFLVREVGPGEGLRMGALEAVIREIGRVGSDPSIGLDLRVDGLSDPLRIDFRAEDLAVSYRDEVLGVALRGRSSVKMRARAPRERPIHRVKADPTPSLPLFAE